MLEHVKGVRHDNLCIFACKEWIRPIRQPEPGKDSLLTSPTGVRDSVHGRRWWFANCEVEVIC